MNDLTTSEGLRALLTRLDAAGPGGWQQDDEAADLMRFVMTKYGALARKHGLAPSDAAVAAFEVMQTRAVRTAREPWAVITRAVHVTLLAEERANGLLCSTDRARRAGARTFHDPERFGERDTPLHDFHPAFQVAAAQDDIELSETGDDKRGAPTEAFVAVDKAVDLFVLLGWPRDTAGAALEYISARLVDAGTRSNAHEVLRRDHHARAFLDLDRAAWSTLLRVVLGNPNPDRAHSDAGRGVLLRLLIDEGVEDLLGDDQLVAAVVSSAPNLTGNPHD